MLKGKEGQLQRCSNRSITLEVAKTHLKGSGLQDCSNTWGESDMWAQKHWQAEHIQNKTENTFIQKILYINET